MAALPTELIVTIKPELDPDALGTLLDQAINGLSDAQVDRLARKLTTSITREQARRAKANSL
jgi:hypothetical protein